MMEQIYFNYFVHLLAVACRQFNMHLQFQILTEISHVQITCIELNLTLGLVDFTDEVAIIVSNAVYSDTSIHFHDGFLHG